MPGADIFVDSSVLIYLHDRRETVKSAIAAETLRRIVGSRRARTNLQVLNEVTHVLLRKRWFDTPAVVFSILDDLAVLGDEAITARQTSLARQVHVKTSFSWWDSLLIASALDFGCSYFLTEDLSNGQQIDIGMPKPLTIVDPFAHSPGNILSF